MVRTPDDVAPTSPVTVVEPALVIEDPASTAKLAALLRFRPATVTVSVVFPDISVVGSIAVIVVVPTATAVASPLKPAALLIVAIDPSEELHVTTDVIFCVVVSE